MTLSSSSSSNVYSPMLTARGSLTTKLSPTVSSRSPLPVPIAWFALLCALLILLSVTTFHPSSLVLPSILTTSNINSIPLSTKSTTLLSRCKKCYITQELNHFQANGTATQGTFNQRYFICMPENFNPTNGSIFFYVGNEADVTLYLNHTGIMWENAEAFHALLVFAEHRYFGQSIPFGLDVLNHMEFLSTQQALADYAVLLEKLKDKIGAHVPVIGFGGSYGGMLGTWLRMKYPHIIDGMIAASAPVASFLGDPEDPIDTNAFDRGVTFDMSQYAGAAPNCMPNLRRALKLAVEMSETKTGRHKLAQLLRLCDESSLLSSDDIIAIASDAYSYLAMGNYPYPSSYIMNGKADLPSYPMRVACKPFAGEFTEDDNERLIGALRESISVYYNATMNETCFFPVSTVAAVNESDSSDAAKQAKVDQKGNFWGYLECSELYMPTSSNGVTDVFPASAVNQSRDDAACFEQWGVHLKPRWAHTEFGGMKALRAASNIVFSNGNFDPWFGLGVLESLSPSIVAVPIPGGAHHLDLFFTHPLDPTAVTEARKTELTFVRQWIEEFYAYKRKIANIDLLHA